MEHQLAHARHLLELGRFEDAKQLLRQRVVAEPDDSYAHGLLALTHVELDEHGLAREHAERAVGCAPNEAFTHYVLGVAALHRQDLDAAREAARHAIELAPNVASNHGLLANAHLLAKDWRDALRAADAGLALDPDDEQCVNARAQALTRLGREREAGETLAGQLARTPEDAHTHANVGWTKLNHGDYEAARTHFREALRLEPTLEWARDGIRQALQARHWFYRPVLRFFLWMDRLKAGRQFAILVGGYLLYRFALGLARDGTPLAPVAWALVGVYLVFVALTWFSNEVSAALLSLHPDGRLALWKREAWFARLFTLTVVAGFACLGLGFVADRPLALSLGFTLLVLCVGVVTVPQVEASRRPIQIALCCAVALFALGGFGLNVAAEATLGEPGNEEVVRGLRGVAGLATLVAVVLAFWIGPVLANYLNTRERG